MNEKIAVLIAEVDEDGTLEEVRRALDEGDDPLVLVEALREGMSVVGDRYEAKEYFLPDLILSAEIFKEAIALIEPHLKGASMATKGTVVIGTAQGDIHDIGKNIVATMLRCNGLRGSRPGGRRVSPGFRGEGRPDPGGIGGHVRPAHPGLRRHEGYRRRPGRGGVARHSSRSSSEAAR